MLTAVAFRTVAGHSRELPRHDQPPAALHGVLLGGGLADPLSSAHLGASINGWHGPMVGWLDCERENPDRKYLKWIKMDENWGRVAPIP